MSRTLIDILLFDRVSRMQNNKSIRKITVSAEMMVKAKVHSGPMNVSGEANYEMRYSDGIDRSCCPLVVFEVKKVAPFDIDVSQCAAYMGRSSVRHFFIRLM
jgi:hypothetical protein